MRANPVPLLRPWSPALGPRERRAAGLALGLSLAVHVAVLGLLPDWRSRAAPQPPTIQVTLLAPSPDPAPAAPAAAPRLPVSKPQARPAPPRPAVLTRPDPAPAAPRVSTAAPSPAAPGPAVEVPDSPPVAAPLAIDPPPAPAAPPAQAVAAPTVDPRLLDRYGQALSDLLARQQQYPRLAAARGWEGDVVLKLVIARKGQLVAARVIVSSGHAVLDEHALALVAEAQPFPALPGPGSGDDLEVTVPVHYQLNKKS